MINKLLTIFMAVICSVSSYSAYSQSYKSCATNEVHEENLKKDPSLHQKLKGIENHTKLYEMTGANAKMTAITIPVVVHVIYNTAAQNISDAQILSQIDVLNEDFRKLNSDASLIPSVWQNVAADAQIEFCLAGRDPQGNPTSGITRTYTALTSFSTNNAMKYTSQGGKDIWDRNQYLNIWVCNMSGNIAGYAQFPGGSASSDGVVVHYTTFGRTGTLINGYNKGRVTTHEVGHWLNLRHIWGDSSCGNDYVSDTPTQSGANYGCPVYPHVTCSNGPSGDMFMNYMDYTLDACKYMFTNGQSTRMNAILAPGGFRFSLTSSLGCVPPGTGNTCNIPSGLNAVVSSSSAILMWNSTGAGSYNVRIKEISSPTWTTTNTAMTSANVSGLNPGFTYEFQVQSVCSSTSSSYSSSFTFTTTSVTCNVPTGLAVTNITSSYVTLVWNSSGASTYIVRYKPASASTWINTSTTQTTISIGGLTGGVTYEVQVQGICSSSSSAFSSSVSFTVAAICNPVTGLWTSNVTTNSATLWWANSGAASYNVRYKQTSSGTWSNLNTSQSNVAITGLTPGTIYEFQVQSVCSGASSVFSATATFTTSVPPCPVPTGLSATNITTFSATLSWNSTGAASYYFRYKPVSSTTWSTLLTNLTSVSINGLIAGVAYEFQVQSVCSTNSSPFSNSVIFSTIASCDVPMNLSASNITTSTALLSWSGTNSNSFNVRYKPTISTTWTNLSTSQTYTSITGLIPGTSYEFQVQGICATSSSQFSNSSTFTTTVAACNIPVGLSTANVTTSSATLSWSSTGASYYYLRYKISSSSIWNNLITGQTLVNLAGLTAGTNYEFQVQAVCGSVFSGYSASFQFTTTSNVCDVPLDLSVVNITTSSVVLSWSNSGAATYNVRYKPISLFTWINFSTTQTSVSLTSLSSGTAYEFQVQSDCGSINSTFSESATFTTLIQSCNAPVGLYASNITNTTVHLSWSNTGANSYYVKYRNVNSFNWSYFQTLSTSVNLAGLIAGANYEFQVKSVCGTTTSGYSQSVNFTTLGTTCTIPSGLTSSNLTETTATLSWNNTGATTYYVNYKLVSAVGWNTVSTSLNSINIASLLPNSNYEFQVQSNCGNSNSGFSNWAPFTTTGLLSNVITIGNGTSTSELPYGTAFMAQKAQFFISKAELDAAGYNPLNNIISSLGFYVTNASNQVMNNFTIKIAHITTSAFANNYFINTFNSTTVFTGNVTAVSNSWNVHYFDNPFIYNGVNNLLIEICFDNNTSSSNSMVTYSLTTQPTILYNQQNISNAGICNINHGILSNSRPNIQFSFSGGSNKNSSESIIEPDGKNNLVIYPNPASSQTTINFELSGADDNCSVALYNAGGSLVFSEKIEGIEGKNEHRIDFGSSPESITPGLYFIKVITTGRVFFSSLLIN